MFKKTVIIATILGIAIGAVSVAIPASANTILSPGLRGEEVKNLQEVLKIDSKIYPEGLTTGYFGRLTENAIKKIQAKCGLPETGVVDDATERCIYPVDYQVKVISPNGGEVWDRNQIQTIRWEATSPTSTPAYKDYPFWNKASIDLFRKIKITPACGTATSTATSTALSCLPVEQSVFVKHIATADLFDQTYSWRIANSIPNGSDYVVRISIGKNIVPIWSQERALKEIEIDTPTDIWPVPAIRGFSWDESDGKFTITGESNCTCPECPTCNCPNVSEVIKILENITAELNKAMALLKSILAQSR